MSIEIVLIPLAIAITKEIAEGVAELKEKAENYKVLETPMKDENLLKQALAEWSCAFRKLGPNEKKPMIRENEAVFIQNENGNFALVLPQTADVQEYKKWLQSVEESYTHYLQQHVYQNLLKKAEERGLVLESEEVLEDHSIQITYVLNK